MRFDIVELIQRQGATKRKLFIAPAIEPTGAQEQALRRLYMRVVREWGRLVLEQIMPAYTRTIGEGIRDAPEDVRRTVEDATGALNRLVLTMDAELEDWTVRVEEWHRGRFGTLFTPVGVRLETMLGRGDVAGTLQATLGENTSLIRSLNDQMRNGISGAVFRGLTDRATARDVAREIRKTTGIGARRAELIAADQLQKLTGRLDEERQEQVGIEKFEWMHSRKAKPRPEHVERNGKIFAWNSTVAKTDPPGRAIRCGCRARAVVEIEEDAAEAIEPPAPPAPPPPPPPPAPPRFEYRSPINPKTTDVTIKVQPKAAVQKQMSAALARSANHAAYTNMPGDNWGGRSPKDHGRAALSAEFDNETASMVGALAPELDDLADQIGIPRLRGYKSITGNKAAGNMGDGVMGLNPGYMNGYADRVGGREPGGAAEPLRRQREELKLAAAPLMERLRGLKTELEAIGMRRDEEWLAKYNEFEAARKELLVIRDKDDKLWRKLTKLEHVAKGDTPTQWKPGDNLAARPYTASSYFSGIDRARQLMFHEFAHHVHQMLHRTGTRRAVGPPPLERELRRLWSTARLDHFRMGKQLSKYGTTNEHEWFAENFSAFIMGRRDLVDDELADLIERIFRREY